MVIYGYSSYMTYIYGYLYIYSSYMVITCYCITSLMNVVYHISNMYYIPSGKLTYTSNCITMENHNF